MGRIRPSVARKKRTILYPETPDFPPLDGSREFVDIPGRDIRVAEKVFERIIMNPMQDALD